MSPSILDAAIILRMSWRHAIAFITIVALAAACGTSSATPTPLSTEAVRDRAADALSTVSTTRFHVEDAGADTDLGGGLMFREADGVAVFPDRATTTVLARFSALNVNVELGITQIKGDAYMQDPLSNQWRPVPADSLPFVFSGMNAAVAGALASATGLALATDAEAGGVSVYVLTGRITPRSLRALIPGAIEGGTLDVEAWVGKADFFVRRLRLTGALLGQDGPDAVRVLELSGFNEPVTIERPF